MTIFLRDSPFPIVYSQVLCHKLTIYAWVDFWALFCSIDLCVCLYVCFMSAFISSALLMETCKQEILFHLLHIKQPSIMINDTFSALVRVTETVGNGRESGKAEL